MAELNKKHDLPGPTVDICVTTYKRPVLLKKLLESLIQQKTGGKFAFNIIVVDNDKERSAEKTVAEFNNNGHMILYDVEAEKNIALTRNRALSLTSGDLIATIDDDEFADEKWLLNSFTTLNNQQADVVLGPVHRVFEGNPPEYIRSCELFNWPNPVTGATENFVMGTGNSLFKKEVIRNIAQPFSPELGLTGAEDVHFFTSLRERGYKIAWCRDAEVFEFIPKERARFGWVMKRYFRVGNTFFRTTTNAAGQLQLPEKPLILFLILRLMKLSLLSLFYGFAGILIPKRRIAFFETTGKVFFYSGIFSDLFKIQYREYN